MKYTEFEQNVRNHYIWWLLTGFLVLGGFALHIFVSIDFHQAFHSGDGLGNITEILARTMAAVCIGIVAYNLGLKWIDLVKAMPVPDEYLSSLARITDIPNADALTPLKALLEKQHMQLRHRDILAFVDEQTKAIQQQRRKQEIERIRLINEQQQARMSEKFTPPGATDLLRKITATQDSAK